MHQILIIRLPHPRCSNCILLRILPNKMPPQKPNHQYQQRITPKVRRKRDIVPRAIPAEKDLGPDTVPDRPCDEVRGHDGAFLSLSRDVARDEGEGEGLCGPEGEGEIVGDQEADLLGFTGVFDRHEDDCANKGSEGGRTLAIFWGIWNGRRTG